MNLIVRLISMKSGFHVRYSLAQAIFFVVQTWIGCGAFGIDFPHMLICIWASTIFQYGNFLVWEIRIINR